MTFKTSSLCIISIFMFFTSSILIHEAESSKSCPIFSLPPNGTARSPININTKEAIYANVSSPVTLRNGVFGFLLIVNNGRAFEVYGYPLVPSGGRLFGGVLCGKRLVFYKIRIYITHKPNGRSYNTINGKGSVITFSVHYFDARYGTFIEALKHPHAVHIVHISGTISPLANPLFILPSIAIPIFRYPGTKLYFPLEALLYAWFDILPIAKDYYAYPGSYVDYNTGKKYFNVIEIQIGGFWPVLSQKQFDVFKLLLNKDGKPLETVEPLQKTNAPVYHGDGVAQTLSIF